MSAPRAAACVAALALALAPAAAAQDSQFGIRSPGTPGRWESVRARTTGGAFAFFDARSAVVDAALADATQLTASAVEATSYRHADYAGASAELRSTRFPLFSVAGPVARRVTVGGGFASYLDKTYEITLQDTLTLRGAPVPVTDDVASDGGVSDLRLSAASRLGSRVAVGLGAHVLVGSTRITVRRTFSDTTYRTSLQVDEVRYDGFGVSGSVLLDPLSTLRIAAFARSDGRLRTRVESALVTETNLPTTVGAALRWAPSPSARLAAGVTRRSWGDAGAGAFNTVDWSAGLEIGSLTRPLRFGVRGGQLPFGPGPRAPTEWGVAAGTGFGFAAGHGLLDFGIERLERKGAGATERVWTLLAGLTVRP